MPVYGANAIRATMPETDLERLKNNKGATLDQEKARLKEAAKQFEALFSYQLLKVMRETIPDNPLADGVPMANGAGKDIFTQLFDMEVAQKMTGNGRTSLADLLYKSMEKAVDAQFGQKPEIPAIKSLRAEQPESIPIHRNPVEDLPKRLPIPLHRTSEIISQDLHQMDISGDPIVDKYGDLIRNAAKTANLKPELVYAVIKHESAGDTTAISPKGAKGLMQLMDSTAADYGVSDPSDPVRNVEAGTRYLSDLVRRFDGDIRTALAAYNAGPGTVERHGGVPPYKETREYIERIIDTMSAASGMFTDESTKGQ
jgi:Rod binding domain-containing protein